MNRSTTMRCRTTRLAVVLGGALALAGTSPVFAQHHGHGGGHPSGGGGFGGGGFGGGGFGGGGFGGGGFGGGGFGGGVPAHHNFGGGGFGGGASPFAQGFAPPQHHQTFAPPAQGFAPPQHHQTFAPPQHHQTFAPPQHHQTFAPTASVHHGMATNPAGMTAPNIFPAHHPQAIAPGNAAAVVRHPGATISTTGAARGTVGTHTVLKPQSNGLNPPASSGLRHPSNAMANVVAAPTGHHVRPLNVLPNRSGPAWGSTAAHPLAGHPRPVVSNMLPKPNALGNLHLAPGRGLAGIGSTATMNHRPFHGPAGSSVAAGMTHFPRPVPGLHRTNGDLLKQLSRATPSNRPGHPFPQSGNPSPLAGSNLAGRFKTRPGVGTVLAPFSKPSNLHFKNNGALSVQAFGPQKFGLGPKTPGVGTVLSAHKFGVNPLGLGILSTGIGSNLGFNGGFPGLGMGLGGGSFLNGNASPLGGGPLGLGGGGLNGSLTGLLASSNPGGLSAGDLFVLSLLAVDQVEIGALQAILANQSWNSGYGGYCDPGDYGGGYCDPGGYGPVAMGGPPYGPVYSPYPPAAAPYDPSAYPAGGTAAPQPPPGDAPAAGGPPLVYTGSESIPANGGVTTIGGVSGVVENIGGGSGKPGAAGATTEGEGAAPAKVATSDEGTPTPPDPAPSSGPRLVLTNPKDSGGTVNYVLDGQTYTIEPGGTQAFASQPSRLVEFDRGDTFGQARYGLSEGTYTFTVTDKGWDLLGATFQATLDNSANPNDFNFVLDGRAEVVKAGQTQVLTSKYELLLSFDAGDGAAPATKALAQGTYRVGLDSTASRLDLIPLDSRETAPASRPEQGNRQFVSDPSR